MSVRSDNDIKQCNASGKSAASITPHLLSFLFEIAPQLSGLLSALQLAACDVMYARPKGCLMCTHLRSQLLQTQSPLISSWCKAEGTAAPAI
jgi:hypothetical protein